MDEDNIIDLTLDSNSDINETTSKIEEIETDVSNADSYSSELEQLNHKGLTELREKLIDECEEICPVLGKKIQRDKFVLDHQHKTSKETIGENGAGLCRGVMEFRCNALEGKIFNNYKRLGLNKEIELPNLLRNLATYLERPNLPFVHPKEKPKKPKLMKSSYNKLVKQLQKSNYRKPIPEFPKSGHLTKSLRILYEKMKMEPQFKK